MKDVDVSRLHCWSQSDPDQEAAVSKPVASALRGAVKQTTSWLFHAVMTQHLDLPTIPRFLGKGTPQRLTPP
jgi:hypothetical protein